MWIVLEGIDGSGKTTLGKRLTQTLNSMKDPGNHDSNQGGNTVLNDSLSPSNYLYISEPSDSDSGKKIREILGGKETFPGDKNMLELFFTDRLHNISVNIKPTLTKNKHVIQDRYFFSTAAYQGKDSEQAIEILESYLEDARFLLPNHVFFLDLKPEQALERINFRLDKQKQQREIFESEEKLLRTYENYLEVFRIYKNFILSQKTQSKFGVGESHKTSLKNLVFLDGNLSTEQLEKQILQTVFAQE